MFIHQLFSGSHLLDLTSSDENYRKESLEQLQRVLDLTNSLAKSTYHRRHLWSLMLVVSASMISYLLANANLCIRKQQLRYRRLMYMMLRFLYKQCRHSVALWRTKISQYLRMPIRDSKLREEYSFNIFDTSHTSMACNHLGLDFYSSLSNLLPYTRHLHISDSAGTGDEGLQIGSGSIDFYKLSSILKTSDCKSFYPRSLARSPKWGC